MRELRQRKRQVDADMKEEVSSSKKWQVFNNCKPKSERNAKYERVEDPEDFDEDSEKSMSSESVKEHQVFQDKGVTSQSPSEMSEAP